MYSGKVQIAHKAFWQLLIKKRQGNVTCQHKCEGSCVLELGGLFGGVLGVLEMFANPTGPAKCLSFSFCGGLSPGTFRISLAPRWGTLSQHEMPTPKSCAILCSEVSFCVGCSCCCSSLGESSRPATISLTRQPATQKRRRVGQMRSPQFAHFVYTCFPAVFTRLLALPWIWNLEKGKQMELLHTFRDSKA